MNKSDKIFIAGSAGMVGSAIVRHLLKNGFNNIIGTYRTRVPKGNDGVEYFKIDLMNQASVDEFFETHKPEYVFYAAAKVGGIVANNTYRAQFLYENIQIQNNIIHSAYMHKVKKLLNLGSSCI